MLSSNDLEYKFHNVACALYGVPDATEDEEYLFSFGEDSRATDDELVVFVKDECGSDVGEFFIEADGKHRVTRVFYPD